MGATALSAFYTRCLLFNGSSYLGNENETKSRPYFPIEQMSVSHGAKGHTTMLSHHQFKIKREKKKFKWERNAFLKKKSFLCKCMYRKIHFLNISCFWWPKENVRREKPINNTWREKTTLHCKLNFSHLNILTSFHTGKCYNIFFKNLLEIFHFIFTQQFPLWKSFVMFKFFWQETIANI